MDFQVEELIIAAASAVQGAQKVLEHNSVELYYNEYECKTNDDGTSVFLPIMRQLGIPTADGGTSILQVPVTTLYNHNSLGLEHVIIKLNASLSISNDTKTLNAKVGKLDNETSYGSEFESGHSEIELFFKRSDPPEGIARQNQELLKLL